MKQDILKEAALALREETATEQDARAAETRARILRETVRQTRKRFVVVHFLVPLAAVMVTGVAYGTTTGRVPSWIRSAVSGWTSPTAPARAPAPSVARGASPPVVVAAEIPDAGMSLPPVTAPTAEVGAVTQPEEGRKSETTAPSSASALSRGGTDRSPGPVAQVARVAKVDPPRSINAPRVGPVAPVESVARSGQEPPLTQEPAALPQSAEPPEVDEDRRLYLVAHRHHFFEHDTASALSAWDTYLKAMPRGRFATEAHYNRALCLVRLGRSGEAMPILESFASGRFGTYRMKEARTLLDALR